MSKYAYITTLKNLRPHPNADRLMLGECFDNTVCVDMSYQPDEVGIYIGEGAQLSELFCMVNNLLRTKDGNGGYLDPKHRNVKTIRLRGERSDGIFLHLSSLALLEIDTSVLKIGDCVDTIQGIEIATKYIPTTPVIYTRKDGNRTRKKKENICPLLKPHVDTEQLVYNLNNFKPGDEIEITLKMHGTSSRTGYLPMLKGHKRSLIDRLKGRRGTPIHKYGYVTGTRRTIVETVEGGYYGNDQFRKDIEATLLDKLEKNETIYGEIVGYTTTGTPIMGEAKVPKDYQKEYGKKMVFNYGTKSPNCEFYAYRMTLTNEDGFTIDYSPDQLRYRCEQMGIKTVPVLDRFIIPLDCENPGQYVLERAKRYYEGADLIDSTHVREGVVVRRCNAFKFEAYKLKNYLFKLISGIIVENTNETSTDILEEM